MAREEGFLRHLIAPKSCLVALHETGAAMDSREFAAFLRDLDENARRPVFVVGGPFGLSPALLADCRSLLSLSPMTFPHELARVMLLEQLFRAETILRRFPYHH